MFSLFICKLVILVILSDAPLPPTIPLVSEDIFYTILKTRCSYTRALRVYFYE